MIVEFDFSSGVLESSIRAAPSVSLSLEEMTASDTVPLRNIFWASGEGLDRFEAALSEDPTVEDATRLFETGDRRLYRIVYPSEMADVAAYRAAVELDAVVLAAENEGTDWIVRMRFPDRTAFAAFRERCERRGLSIAARAVYTRTRFETVDTVLTPHQYEALSAAAEMGYYSVPRDCSLAELAESLGLSSQAVSERLRRGTERLLSVTIEDS